MKISLDGAAGSVTLRLTSQEYLVLDKLIDQTPVADWNAGFLVEYNIAQNLAAIMLLRQSRRIPRARETT